MATVLSVSVCICVKMCNLGPVLLNTTAACLSVQKHVASVMVMLRACGGDLTCLAVFFLARCAYRYWQIKVHLYSISH